MENLGRVIERVRPNALLPLAARAARLEDALVDGIRSI